MKSIYEQRHILQGTNDYGTDCLVGKKLAQEFLRELINAVNHPKYNGLERHALGDLLLGSGASGVQINFCYELLRQIEPALIRH